MNITNLSFTRWNKVYLKFWEFTLFKPQIAFKTIHFWT